MDGLTIRPAAPSDQRRLRAAVVELHERANCYGYVSDICVLPPFRGRRIASALLEALEARLRRGGVVRIRLSALAANAAARRVYERSGYALYEVVYEKSVGADNEDLTP
jgi:ribosomal protein S18 acetylase RimI-like enzyme